MTASVDPRCEGGCTFPTIDFGSGTDEIYVCGELAHASKSCLLLKQSAIGAALREACTCDEPKGDHHPDCAVLSLPAEQRARERRRVLAQHLGQIGWALGYGVSRIGRHLERLGDRIIDGGDWLAAKVAGR